MRIGMLVIAICDGQVERVATVADVDGNNHLDLVVHEDDAGEGEFLLYVPKSDEDNDKSEWSWREMDERDVPTRAKAAYEAYTAHSGGKNYRGDPCPTWDDLPEAIRGHWAAAAEVL